MPQTARLDLQLRAGDTFSQVFRYGAGPIVYKPITAIERSAPVLLTVPAHGVVDGWPVAITNVAGMTQINGGSANALKARDYRRATVVSPDQLLLNAINATGFAAYKSGGVLQYSTPVDLADALAQLLIYPDDDPDNAIAFTSGDGSIVLDNVAKTITITIDVPLVANVAALIADRKGSFDFNLIRGERVSSLAGGLVTIDPGTAGPT